MNDVALHRLTQRQQ